VGDYLTSGASITQVGAVGSSWDELGELGGGMSPLHAGGLCGGWQMGAPVEMYGEAN